MEIGFTILFFLTFAFLSAQAQHQSLQFEIKGHLCCTSSKNLDAIDKETQNRNLSLNRAKTVFAYLRFKGISRIECLLKAMEINFLSEKAMPSTEESYF